MTRKLVNFTGAIKEDIRRYEEMLQMLKSAGKTGDVAEGGKIIDTTAETIALLEGIIEGLRSLIRKAH